MAAFDPNPNWAPPYGDGLEEWWAWGRQHDNLTPATRARFQKRLNTRRWNNEIQREQDRQAKILQRRAQRAQFPEGWDRQPYNPSAGYSNFDQYRTRTADASTRINQFLDDTHSHRINRMQTMADTQQPFDMQRFQKGLLNPKSYVIE